MVRKSLLIAILTISTAMWGQGRSSSGASTSPATPSGPTPGVPTTQGAIGGVSGQAAAGPVAIPGANPGPTVPQTMAGPAATAGTNEGNPAAVTTTTTTNGVTNGGFFGGGVVATPIATFAAPAPTAGISSAGIAGISANTPASTGVQTTLSPSTIVFTSGVPLNPPAVNLTAAGASGRLINDMGPSFFANALPATHAVSLGEVAAAIKARGGVQNVRVYTNDDAQRIANHLTVNGTNANLPPTGSNTTEPATNGTVATTQTSPQPAPAAAPSATQPEVNTNIAAGKPSPGTMIAQAQPPANPTNAQAASSTEQQSATTPQVNQTKPGATADESRRLPASATLLPLLALVGLLSGGFGFLLRKLKG